MTQPDTLHDRIRAEIDRRLAVARAATPGPWKAGGIGDYGWTVQFPNHDGWSNMGVETEDNEQGKADAEHIALHDPADAVRRYEGELEVLERHRPVQERDNLGPVVICAYEWGDSDGYMVRYDWCPEVKALAHRLGVSVDA